MLTAVGDFEQPEPTYPNGSHIAEVEIDPETGVTEIVGYMDRRRFRGDREPDRCSPARCMAASSRAIGQALYEHTVYDDDGQLLTALVPRLRMPRADCVPCFHFETRNVPSNTNAFGIKGAGEAGIDRLLPGGDERHRRCAQPRLRHRAHRHAGDAGAGLVGDPGGAEVAAGQRCRPLLRGVGRRVQASVRTGRALAGQVPHPVRAMGFTHVFGRQIGDCEAPNTSSPKFGGSLPWLAIALAKSRGRPLPLGGGGPFLLASLRA